MINIQEIPDINKYCLQYVLEDLKISNDNDNLWLEFGVATGTSINYISQFTTNNIYGFDSFEGLPEDWIDDNNHILGHKGVFSLNGNMPQVNSNVILIKGLFQDTLDDFLDMHKNKKISFVHIDCDLYSSTKCVLEKIYPFLDKNCIIVFDELVNIKNDSNELRALNEFIDKYNISYKWIGMLGNPNMQDQDPQHHNNSVALYINI